MNSKKNSCRGNYMRKYGSNAYDIAGKWVGDVFSLGIATTKDQAHVNAYISLKVRTPGKNHIAALGFSLVCINKKE